MIDAIANRLMENADPLSLALLLFVVYLIYEKREYKKDCTIVMTSLLKAQEERGITLTKITMMIDQLLRTGGRTA